MKQQNYIPFWKIIAKHFFTELPESGKSELAKSYVKYYKKHYTNILYFEYAGDLHQSVTDMDFADDLPEDTEEERFRKHNRFLRSLKDDTLIIIDNFNATATQDSFLSVMLKYRCRILFTTRSKFDSYCTLHLKEIKESSSLFQLVSSFYSEAEEHRAIVEKIHRNCTLPYFCCRTGSKTSGKWNFSSASINLIKTSRGKRDFSS